jgi:hypothetical protein
VLGPARLAGTDEILMFAARKKVQLVSLIMLLSTLLAFVLMLIWKYEVFCLVVFSL